MPNKLISIAESILINQLETYTNIPFFLGILYLSLKENNELYIGDTKVKLGVDNLQSYLYTSVGTGWKINYITSFKYYHPQFKDLTKIHPFLTICHFKNPPQKDKNLLKEYNKVYIYYRNKYIKNLLSVLVNNYMKEYGYIPFLYATPYLYYNRTSKLRIESPYLYENHFLNYNLQNNTLGVRPVDSIRRYGTITTPTDLMELYGLSLSSLYALPLQQTKQQNDPKVLITLPHE